MAPNELANQLEETLRRANAILFMRGRSVLVNMEIPGLQFDALVNIREYGPLTMGELGKKLFVACSTATDLADRMERAGLAVRVRDAKDRRIVRLHLLPRGREALEGVTTERQKLVSEVLRDYTDQEYKELSCSLELLAKRMALK